MSRADDPTPCGHTPPRAQSFWPISTACGTSNTPRLFTYSSKSNGGLGQPRRPVIPRCEGGAGHVFHGDVRALPRSYGHRVDVDDVEGGPGPPPTCPSVRKALQEAAVAGKLRPTSA